MKLTKFLFAILLFIPLLQSCQNDVSNLDDPRDALVKKWSVSESGANYYCNIYKDANESTRIYFKGDGGEGGFHNLQLTTPLYATFNGSSIEISSQTIDGYTISNGIGTSTDNFKTIHFVYTVREGANPPDDFTAEFGPVVTSKKKVVKPVM
jgi:hypothetical protein